MKASDAFLMRLAGVAWMCAAPMGALPPATPGTYTVSFRVASPNGVTDALHLA